MKKIIPFLLLALIVSSCSSIKVTSDYDSTVDFTQFKTFSFYGWVDGSDQLISVFDKKRIEKAFKDEFSKRHLKFVEKDGDLLIALFVVTENKTKRSSTSVHVGTGYGYGYGGYYGYGPGWGWGGGYTSTSINDYNYVEGTLVCDVYDRQAEQLIWEGIATKAMDRPTQDKDRLVQYAVQQVMARYPIPAAKK